MAEETEVKNVGGDNGVASEVTLAKLVAAMEKIAAKTGADPKSQAAKAEKARTESISQGIKVSTKHRDAVKKNTDAVNLSTKAFKSLSGGLVKITAMLSGAVFESLTGFTKELFGASRNLSNFVSHIPLIGGRLSQLTGLIDESYDTFQQLAKSGAAFDYNLIELRNTAASTRISLGEFANMVTENSEKLAMFGGTVDQGVKRIANLRDTMGSDLTERFERLGLTTEEINEALIYQQYLNRAGARTETRNANEQALAAASLTKNMLTLAKLTGEDIKTQQDKIAQAQQDVAFQRELSKLDKDERKKLNEAMSEAQAAGGDAAVEVLKAKFLGMPPLTEAAQLYTATQTEGAELIKKNLDKALNSAVDYDQFMLNREDRMSEYGEAYARAANRLDGIIKAEAAGLEGLGIAEQMMASQKLFGVYIDDSGRFVKEEFEKVFKGLSDEDDAGTGLDGAASFRTALDNARKALKENIINPLQGVAAEILNPLTESFKKFIGEDGASTVFQESLDNLRIFLDKTVTPKIEDFFEAFAEDPKQALKDAYTGIVDAIADFLLGPNTIQQPSIGEVEIEREGGALQKIIKPLMTNAVNALVEGVSAWWSETSPFTKAMIAGAAGLFVLGGPIAGAFVSGITGLLTANALKNGIAGRSGLSGDVPDRGGKSQGRWAKLGSALTKFTKAVPLLGTAISAGMGMFDQEYKEAGYGVVDRAGLGIAEGGLDLLDFGANTTNKGVNWLTNSLFGKEFFDTDIDTSGGFKDWVNSDQGRSWLQFGSDNKKTSTSTQPRTPTQTVPKMDPDEIRNEKIDPDDPDPLLAREAREQRARFADSMPSSQESTKQELSRLNNNNSQLLAVLQETRDINKKTLRAIENIGTV